MVSINLYQSNKVNCTIDFPSEWNELLPHELLSVCQRQLSQFKDVHEQIVAVFNDLFISRSKKYNKSLPKDFYSMLDPEDTAMNALPLVDFLYRQNRLTTQLFPVIKLPGILDKKMYGPESDFDNLTCGEFEDAEIFFHNFIAKPSPDSLAHLAAILWRPQHAQYISFNSKTQKWLTYNHEKVYDDFLKLKQHQLYALFVWYAGCRSILPLIFPTVYKKNPDEKKSDEPDLLAFTKCIHGAAGPKNGSRTEIRRTLLKEFYMELEIEAQNNEKLIEEYASY